MHNISKERWLRQQIEELEIRETFEVAQVVGAVALTTIFGYISWNTPPSTSMLGVCGGMAAAVGTHGIIGTWRRTIKERIGLQTQLAFMPEDQE